MTGAQAFDAEAEAKYGSAFAARATGPAADASENEADDIDLSEHEGDEDAGDEGGVDYLDLLTQGAVAGECIHYCGMEVMRRRRQ